MASFPFSFPAATAPASATGVDSLEPAFTLPPKVTPAQAYDAILQPASPPLRDRAEEAARRALECAEALAGSVQGESFGWHRRQKREGLLDDQLAILRRFARQDTAPGEPIGQGGEHEVWHTENGTHVSKFTIHDQFGYIVDQENDNRANKLRLRPALPCEYLMPSCWRLCRCRGGWHKLLTVNQCINQEEQTKWRAERDKASQTASVDGRKPESPSASVSESSDGDDEQHQREHGAAESPEEEIKCTSHLTGRCVEVRNHMLNIRRLAQVHPRHSRVKAHLGNHKADRNQNL